MRLTIEPLPLWLDTARLLAPLDLRQAERTRLDAEHERLALDVPAEQAALIDARLRGLGLDGRPLCVQVTPPLARARVRAARLLEARARRETSPGFVRPGARATGEGRFSLTPEALALALGRAARALVPAGQPLFVVDACCGSGGNAIGFARAGCSVHALELDPARLDEARHNAALYGVSEQIVFEQADARERVPSLRADLLFVDPPWGQHYDKRATTKQSFPLLSALLERDLSAHARVWLKLPSSFEVGSLPGAEASAWFGTAAGDAQRVKFVLLRL
ncbi:MAG: tgs1 [Myxococcaceae bacterium]|nr:tgs1 [Myxococcaceae bacterium]